MKPWGSIFALMAWLYLLHATEAFASEVLVVKPPADDEALFEAFGRLRAELELQGFDVLVLEGSEEPIDPEALELETQKRNAFAAVALQRKSEGTTAVVHIVDRVTGKTLSRTLDISKTKDGPLLLAIRAADLLRASFLELEPGKSPPEDVVGVQRKPPPQEVVRFSRRLPRFQIGVGGVLLWHPDLGPSLGGGVAAHYRAHERAFVGIEFGGPAFGGEYRFHSSSASVREEFAMLVFMLNLGSTTPGPHWEWGPLVEVGLVHVTARGEVSPPLTSQTSQVWTFGAMGGAFVEAYLTQTVSIGLALKCLGQFPQPVIAIADERSIPLAVQGVGTLRLGVSF